MMCPSTDWSADPRSRRLLAVRLLAVAVAGAATAAGLTGCGGRYQSPREVVVTFRPTATQAQHDAARAACATAAGRTTPEPAPTSTLPATRLNDVRFRVDEANDPELAQLYDCLRRQPGVLGIDLPND